ncbi:MAG: DNA repair protein RadC [Bacteroidota bacterium]
MEKGVESYKYLTINELAIEDRPREKLITQGAHALSNAELLAILLGSGLQNVTSIDLAKHLLKAEDHCLNNIAKRSIQELTRHRGIGPAKATTIASAMELGKRLAHAQPKRKPKIKSAKAAYEIIRPYLADKVIEEAWIMLLNRQSRLIKSHQVSKGGLAKTTIDPRVIFKTALEYHAHALIMVHNHPSGDLRPSGADIDMTTFLVKGAHYLDIKIIDHLILTTESYFSFAENGLLAR